MKKQIQVVAGILCHNQHYLAVQRGKSKFDYISYKWEFPGGKIEQGESAEAAIIRELGEELNITVQQPTLITTVQHQYPDFEIKMSCFLIEVSSQQITLSEHITHRWLTRSELNDVDWASADIPVVECLMRKSE